MATYQILDWRHHYENHRSRELKNCTFVCVPNNQHNEAMLRILADPDGVAIYGIWCLLLGSASQHKDRDGWLTSDGTVDGKPWTPEYIALRYRTTEALAAKTIDIISSDSVGWIVARENRAETRDDARSARESRAENAKSTERGGSARDIEGGTEKGELEPELEEEKEGPATPTDPPPKENQRKELAELDAKAKEVWFHWLQVFGPSGKTFTAKSKRRKKVLARLREGKTVEELKQAIDGCHGDEWWRETGNHDLSKICESPDLVEEFIEKEKRGDTGKKVSGNGRSSHDIRKTWEAVAGFAIGQIESGDIFGEGVISGFVHSDRLRALLKSFGDTPGQVRGALTHDRWEWTVKERSKVLAEKEISGVQTS